MEEFMLPKRNRYRGRGSLRPDASVEILPTGFDLEAIQSELARLSTSPSMFEEFVITLRLKYKVGKALELIELAIAAVQTNTAFIKAQAAYDVAGEERRTGSALAEAAFKLKQATLQADIAEAHLRRARAEAAKRDLRKPKTEKQPEPAKPESQPTPEQQKARRHTASERRLRDLSRLKRKAEKIKDPDERVRKANAIQDEIDHEMEEWRRTL